MVRGFGGSRGQDRVGRSGDFVRRGDPNRTYRCFLTSPVDFRLTLFMAVGTGHDAAPWRPWRVPSPTRAMATQLPKRFVDVRAAEW
jgi:hypothetical protein